jgi:transposase
MMKWPARNPDLNSIEYLWDNMEKLLRPNDFSQLTRALLDIWENIG